jgi:hypothetical protein
MRGDDYSGLPSYGTRYLERVEELKWLLITRQISPLEQKLEMAGTCFFCLHHITGKVYTLKTERLISGRPVEISYFIDEACLAEAKMLVPPDLIIRPADNLIKNL